MFLLLFVVLLLWATIFFGLDPLDVPSWLPSGITSRKELLTEPRALGSSDPVGRIMRFRGEGTVTSWLLVLLGGLAWVVFPVPRSNDEKMLKPTMV